MKLFILMNLFLLLITGCDKMLPQEDPVPKNPLFSGTEYINVTSPVTSGTANPTFVWKSPGTTYQVVGVFTNHIVVSGSKIVNNNKCIAIWTTEMTGSAGNVDYTNNFKKYVYPNLLTTPVTALASGTNYWAVWGMNEDMEVTCSSAEITFVVP
jgi:hypothetical protein